MKSLDHKHRDVIDDIQDLGLLTLAAAYWIMVDLTDYELSGKTLAMLAGMGATARTLSRRILARILATKAE